MGYRLKVLRQRGCAFGAWSSYQKPLEKQTQRLHLGILLSSRIYAQLELTPRRHPLRDHVQPSTVPTTPSIVYLMRRAPPQQPLGPDQHAPPDHPASHDSFMMVEMRQMMQRLKAKMETQDAKMEVIHRIGRAQAAMIRLLQLEEMLRRLEHRPWRRMALRSVTLMLGHRSMRMTRMMVEAYGSGSATALHIFDDNVLISSSLCDCGNFCMIA
ncbi:hypothetical protein V8G54_029662 [Vigna mungo]|uniref:Uncharacterized protein n=1 Tax=Vigna mungo TaxID=3915 RepID=A0AAQ3RKJ0_VIGMU